MSSKQSFVLDGQEVGFFDQDTIMDAAMRAGIYIPHLCHHPEFRPHGSCRLCIVEVNGRITSACTQPAKAGKQVISVSRELNNYRKSLLQMLFVEGNHVCPGCEKSGACQLQAVAYYVGMLEPHYIHFFPKRSVDASHADFAIDYNRCILCELCVRASRDVDGKDLFAVSGRGQAVRLIVNSASGKLGDTDFSVHDTAAGVCPVGAILCKHQAYEQPIGSRRYDVQAIDIVGDANAEVLHGED